MFELFLFSSLSWLLKEDLVSIEIHFKSFGLWKW